jgi:hypothetical protein
MMTTVTRLKPDTIREAKLIDISYHFFARSMGDSCFVYLTHKSTKRKSQSDWTITHCKIKDPRPEQLLHAWGHIPRHSRGR